MSKYETDINAVEDISDMSLSLFCFLSKSSLAHLCGQEYPKRRAFSLGVICVSERIYSMGVEGEGRHNCTPCDWCRDGAGFLS